MNNQTQAHYVYNQQYPGQRFQSQAQVQQYPGQRFQSQAQVQQYPGQRFPAQTQAQAQQTQAQAQQTQAQTQQVQSQTQTQAPRTQTPQYPGAANEIPLYTPTSIDVNNVKDFVRPDGTVKVLFTLVCDNIIIHGMSLVPSNQTGQYFVAFPKRKGSDGKWYSIVYINLSDDVKNYIIDMAWKEIEKLHSAR